MTNQPATNVPRTTTDQALLAAWRRHLDYDAASGLQKVHHSRIRTSIIVLGFAASALAVVTTYQDSNTFIKTIEPILRVILIFLPILSAGMLSYASAFAPSLSWLAYRVGAEMCRREVYLYRMQAADYAGKTTAEQQQLLLIQIEAANKRVNRIGAPDPYLQTTLTDIPKLVLSKTNNPADDGFGPMTPDEYINYRVIPQKDWYIRKSHQDYAQTRRWRIYILLVAGASSIVAALDAAPLVAVTTALGVALVTYMDLRMYGRNFPIYHPIANNLEIEMDRWSVLSIDQRAAPDSISLMVKHVEDLFQQERDQWTQQAIQTQQSIEQSLAKSGQSGSGSGTATTTTTTSNTTAAIYSPDNATSALISVETVKTQSTDSDNPSPQSVKLPPPAGEPGVNGPSQSNTATNTSSAAESTAADSAAADRSGSDSPVTGSAAPAANGSAPDLAAASNSSADTLSSAPTAADASTAAPSDASASPSASDSAVGSSAPSDSAPALAAVAAENTTMG